MDLSNSFTSFEPKLIPPVQHKNIYSHNLLKNSLKLIKCIKFLIVYIIILLVLILIFFSKSLSLKHSISQYNLQKEDLNKQIHLMQTSFNMLVIDNSRISTNLFNLFNQKFSFEKQYSQLQSEYDIVILNKIIKEDISIKRIYKATEDGMTPEAFHSKVDKHYPTVVLITTSRGSRFGGFTFRSWDGIDQYKQDRDAFLFNFDSMYKERINDAEVKYAIYADEKSFPQFGRNDIILNKDFQNGNHLSSYPSSYTHTKLGNKETINELTNGVTYFALKEIEVFSVIFLNEDD